MMAGLGAAMNPPDYGNAPQGASQDNAPQAAPQEDTESPSEDQGEGDTGQKPNVSPEEQAMYDMVVKNALEIIYPKDEKALNPAVAKSLAASDKPTLNLATTAVTIVSQLVQSAKKAGQEIPDDVLYHAGLAILEELAEAMDAFKIAKLSDKDVEHAFYMALDMYREHATQSGQMDPNGLKQEFGQLQQADQQGRLGDVLPGIQSRLKDASKGLNRSAA